MSLKSFLAKIGHAISDAWRFITPFIKRGVSIAEEVTNAMKEFDLQNPGMVDIITKVIPGTADDKIKEKLREELPKIVMELRLVDATLGLTDPNEILRKAIEVLQSLSDHYRVAFLKSLSAIIAAVIADGKLDIKDAFYILDWYHKNKDNPEVDTSLDATAD